MKGSPAVWSHVDAIRGQSGRIYLHSARGGTRAGRSRHGRTATCSTGGGSARGNALCLRGRVLPARTHSARANAFCLRERRFLRVRRMFACWARPRGRSATRVGARCPRERISSVLTPPGACVTNRITTRASASYPLCPRKRVVPAVPAETRSARADALCPRERLFLRVRRMFAGWARPRGRWATRAGAHCPRERIRRWSRPLVPVLLPVLLAAQARRTRCWALYPRMLRVNPRGAVD